MANDFQNDKDAVIGNGMGKKYNSNFFFLIYFHRKLSTKDFLFSFIDKKFVFFNTKKFIKKSAY